MRTGYAHQPLKHSMAQLVPLPAAITHHLSGLSSPLTSNNIVSVHQVGEEGGHLELYFGLRLLLHYRAGGARSLLPQPVLPALELFVASLPRVLQPRGVTQLLQLRHLGYQFLVTSHLVQLPR